MISNPVLSLTEVERRLDQFELAKHVRPISGTPELTKTNYVRSEVEQRLIEIGKELDSAKGAGLLKQSFPTKKANAAGEKQVGLSLFIFDVRTSSIHVSVVRGSSQHYLINIFAKFSLSHGKASISSYHLQWLKFITKDEALTNAYLMHAASVLEDVDPVPASVAVSEAIFGLEEVKLMMDFMEVPDWGYLHLRP